jgi:hypothetical protein
MAKARKHYYRSADKTIYVEIDYDRLFHDHYSQEGKKRWLLGADTDRIETFLSGRGYVKINKAQHDKFRESLTLELPTSPILVR